MKTLLYVIMFCVYTVCVYANAHDAGYEDGKEDGVILGASSAASDCAPYIPEGNFDKIPRRTLHMMRGVPYVENMDFTAKDYE